MGGGSGVRPDRIRKGRADWSVEPNLNEAERARFSWHRARAALAGLPGGGLNIAFEAVGRHACGPRAARAAFRFVARDHSVRELGFAQLWRLASRFANALRRLSVGREDRVFVLAERIPELYLAILGSLQCGAVVAPLFAAYGPEPIATRIRLGAGRVLVTTERLYRRKVEGIRADLPTLRHVLLAGASCADAQPPGTLDLGRLMAEVGDEARIEPTREDDLALLHFTSGTTGPPKGAMHGHGAVLAHFTSGRYALDLHDEDTFWCTADPGWVTGTSYGLIAPLVHGVTSVVDEAEFDAARWYRILQEQRVSVWYTAPTAIRLLMKAGVELRRRYHFPGLRFAASVGEPLNPEAVWWGREVLGVPIHDNWWQTETGSIMIANTAAMDIKPGSMGKPLPGIEACIVRRTADRAEPIEAPDVVGELALRKGWPSMFRGYLGQPERSRECFADSWYLTGDLARCDAEGYYWFVGRADDLIKSAGHLIGPFEVESALMEHPAVAEAGVIGMPDEAAGEMVAAFVSIRTGFEPGEALRRELMGHARVRLGPAVAPRQIEFLAALPRTRSGKIMRRLLKARALGLPEGDTSTLEPEARGQ
jgi:acetyl-CoA synthetase